MNLYYHPSTSASPLSASKIEFPQKVTDLTAPGHYTHISRYAVQNRLWRHRNRQHARPTRRSKANDDESDEYIIMTNNNNNINGISRSSSKSSGSEVGVAIDNSNSRICGRFKLWKKLFTRKKKSQPFGFATATGLKLFFHHIIRRKPVFAMCVWVFLFVCEAAMVVLYIIQTTRSENVSWTHYDEDEFGWFFYAHTVLSLVLLSQLVFAYSVSPFTIAVVAVTSIYQIATFLIAYIPGLGWVSRLYVPLFLRCWPMRQYFLFLLDSVAILTPRDHRLDMIRLAAGPLTLFVAMAFTWGCIVHMHQVFRGYPMNIGVAMYWIMVTISTVGFGDVVLQGPDGRAIAIVIIFIFLAKMPTWISIVVSTMRLLRAFPKYNGRRHHILVYGHVRYEDAVSILEEVFALYPMKSVCFCNNKISRDVAAIGRHPRYRLRCTFMQVSVLDKRILKRMRVAEAAAIIILPSTDGASTTRDDDVMLSSIVFQRHASHVPQYLRLRFGLHAKLLRERRKTMIDQHMKTIMATALLLPGVVPFLVNLVRISSAGGISSPTLWTTCEMNNWKGLYEYSRRNMFGSCDVPWFFIHLPLMKVVRLMKAYGVLVVGVEEGSRKLMRLELDYLLEEGDTLLVLHERGNDSVRKALEALTPGAGMDTTPLGAGGSFTSLATVNNFASPFASQQDLFEYEMEVNATQMSDSKIFYPFNRSFDMSEATREGAVPSIGSDKKTTKKTLSSLHSRNNKKELTQHEIQIRELRQQLLNKDFVNKTPCNVSLSEIPLGGSMTVLRELLNCHNAAVLDNPTGGDSIERLEQQINDILTHVAEDYLHGGEVEESEENFLFIDQVSSFKKPQLQSKYDQYLNDAASRYELLQMMQCIRAIHSHSSLTLLTSQKLPKIFLQSWGRTFGSPLHYIRGLSTLEPHLDFALKASGGICNLRGILLYCSQLGIWDFADVPLITVENNIRTLLEWAEMQREAEPREGNNNNNNNAVEQHVVVELQSFQSCISVTPHHRDPIWRKRGEEHFQDSLAFMMGRCFSTNMLLTIFIHAHSDRRILEFFDMVLCLQSQNDLLDVAAFTNRSKVSPTLFQLCGNQLLHFQTFGDAFSFLLSRRSWVAVGVFRQFPESEGLPGVPRYFITNPPLEMPLRADDVMYALAGSAGTQRSKD